MKKFKFTKEIVMMTSLTAFMLLIASCNYYKESDDSKELSEDRNDAAFENNKQENDAQFLVNAAEISMEEIQLGILAQQRGGSSDVQELGRMMEEAHTESLNDLTALAKGKMISIPTTPSNNANDAYKELNEETGNDFDKAYTNKMVKGHKDAIETFEKASKECNDADIKNWATTSLPNLRNHLNQSIECQKKSDKM